ncbi:hypothetical protein [Tsukamurella hominis]|uniref:hypothetical protein n=1 Tax=Tsukamurella hominis TaxID=1970232 RepID=UPI0039E81D3D
MTVKQCLNKFCRALMMYRKGVPKEWHAPEGARASALRIPRDLLDTAREFLTVLTIDEPRPGRELIDHAAPSLYVAPLMEHMGHPPASAESVWQAVRELFRARMRSNVLSKGVGGGLAGHVKRCRFGMDSHETIEIRTVTLSDIKLAILMALQNPQAYSLLTPPPFVTKLSVKMAHGGCSDNSIYRAERLRIDYNNYRRDRREMVPGSSIEDREIERYLSRVADEETSTSATPSGMWGDKLWRGLSNRLDSSRNGEFEGLDGDLALGGICELSARCEVWFSPRFDVDQAIASALEISEKS